MEKVILLLNALCIKHHVRKECGQIAIVNPTQAQMYCVREICNKCNDVKTFNLNKFLTLIDF